MNSTEALAAFEWLYRDLPVYRISHAGRAKLPETNISTTYGEVLASTFPDVLAVAKPRPGEVFCDLGSGAGKAVFLAALLFPFRRAFGFELISELGVAAREVRQRLEAAVKEGRFGPVETEVEFEDGDFLQADLSDVGVVFAVATCFERELLRRLTEKLNELSSGARVVCVGKWLRSEALMPTGSAPCLMDWGMSFANYYLRR